MKICGISDIHGDLSVKIQPCDVLCICGDIVPLEVQVNSKKSKRWLKELFIPWCSKQPCKKVLIVGGNHDFFLWHHPLQMKEMVKEEEKIEYLLNEGYEFEGVKFFGTPLCKEFGYWAFMYPYDEQDRILDKALEEWEKNIDVLLTHDSPYGVSDIILDKSCPWATDEHIGNKSLEAFIIKTAPKLHLHGHLHSTNHDEEILGVTKVYCVSILGEQYTVQYEPQYFDI